MTYANVAATLALLFAMAGGAAAASHYLITSTKQISPKVLKELKKPGAAGTQGPAGSAGAQGAAGANGTNGAPGTKGDTGAKGETGARGETGSQGEKGNASLPAVTWNKKVETAGASIATPKTVVLETIGPFTLTGHCYVSGEKTIAATYIETSEAGSVFAETGGSEEEIEKGEPIPVGAGAAESLTSSHEAAFAGPSEGPFAAQNKAGTIALNGSANEAVFLGNKATPACYFTGTVTEEK
jgi:hypothetical protein